MEEFTGDSGSGLEGQTRIVRGVSRRFVVPIAHRDSLVDDDGALAHAVKVFALSRSGKLPRAIEGWMLHTACMRVLRCVYGSGIDAAIAVAESVFEQRAAWAEAMLEAPALGEANETDGQQAAPPPDRSEHTD